MLKKAFVYIVLYFFSPVLSANTFYDYPLVDLATGDQQQLMLNKSRSVILFFEPDCPWCFKQSKVFNLYLANCSAHVSIIGIGVNGNRQQLKKEAWRLKASFPLYMASAELLASTGTITSTPLLLILDDSGNIIAHRKGYADFDNFENLIQQHSPTAITCPS
jgi:thioredoxin-related protein